MSKNQNTPQDPLEILAAHEAEMDKLFEDLGLPKFDADMDEAAAAAAYTQSLPPVLQAVSIDDVEERHAALQKMIAQKADLNVADGFGSTAAGVLFQFCDLKGLRMLIDAGADMSDFGFGAAHHCVLAGDYAGAAAGSDVDGRGRSPFLLACRLGQSALVAQFLADDIERCLADRTADEDDALTVAMRSGDETTVAMLLDHGFGTDTPDQFGATPLYHAVEMNDLTVAEALLKRGANIDVAYNLTASLQQRKGGFMSKITALQEKFLPVDTQVTINTLYDMAYTPEMVHLLITHGANPALFHREVFAAAIGADRLPERILDPTEARAGCHPKYGTQNPEKVDFGFWYEQIRTNRSAYSGKVDVFGKDDDLDGPVWSFDRFGRTGTTLPDGRLVLIAGEHEDSYDEDFHIYNDVTIMHPGGGMDHYIYPRDVFPPTDFHTATLVGDSIWLIGALGYRGQRAEGQTQVLRLDLDDFSVHPVETTGLNPGWVNGHTAILEGRNILVSGGKVEPGYVDLEGSYVLNLDTLAWSKVN